MSETPVIGASTTGLSIRTGPTWMGASVVMMCLKIGQRFIRRARRWQAAPGRTGCWPRSEEHTSELQSLMRISYAVFCLNKKNTRLHTPHVEPTDSATSCIHKQSTTTRTTAHSRQERYIHTQ